MAKDSGIPRSTLTDLYDNQLTLYVDGETDDDRKDAALDAVRPLPELNHEDHSNNNLDERIRAVVREELERHH